MTAFPYNYKEPFADGSDKPDHLSREQTFGTVAAVVAPQMQVHDKTASSADTAAAAAAAAAAVAEMWFDDSMNDDFENSEILGQASDDNFDE